MSSQEVFTDIYKKRIWFEGSGSGSSPVNTTEYRKFIQAYIGSKGIRSVVDLGCGNWTSSRLIDWGGVQYIGLDVVEEVIAANTAKYGGPNISFLLSDFFRNDLPEADLVIVKDVLQHWPNDMILAFLPKLKRYNHALITDTATSHPGVLGRTALQLFRQPNIDIPLGEMRPLNLAAPPFCENVTEVFRHESLRQNSGEVETKVTVTFGS